MVVGSPAGNQAVRDARRGEVHQHNLTAQIVAANRVSLAVEVEGLQASLTDAEENSPRSVGGPPGQPPTSDPPNPARQQNL